MFVGTLSGQHVSVSSQNTSVPSVMWSFPEQFAYFNAIHNQDVFRTTLYLSSLLETKWLPRSFP